MKRIKVLRVITWLPVGGIERRLVALLPRIDRRHFDVSVVCLRERGPLADELEAAGIPVDCIPFKRRWDLRALHRLADLMREREIDVVHSHMYRSNVPATVAARHARVRATFCQVHNVGTWESRRQLWMDRRLCRFRTAMIGVSQRVCQDIRQHLDLPERKVKLIYNGVELKRFSQARSQRAALRAEHGLDDQKIVILFAARLVPQKRPQDFLEALGRLQRQEGGEKIEGWILGGGPLEAELHQQAKALPNPAGVKFFGAQDEVERFMAAADVFVLPSTKEGFSNAIVEAMACGLPVVASDVGGNAEAVRPGHEGLIISPCAPGELTASLEQLWREDALRGRMAANAAARAELFSIERMIVATEQLYASVLY